MGEIWIYPGDEKVTLEAYPAGDSALGAVVICPGGAYRYVSPRESGPVARAFNREGFTAFVLNYSCENPPLQKRPLQQLSWAVSKVKAATKEYGYSRDRVFTCGFSAGGHLAASLGVTWHLPEWYEEGTDLELHRPAGQILCYPVITAGEYAHRGSFEHLAGESREEQEPYSLENLITDKTPPTFLWHTMEDETVPVENTLLFSERLKEVKVAQEVHLFPYGRHGLSLATKEVEEVSAGRHPDPHVARWFALAAEWLKNCF